MTRKASIGALAENARKRASLAALIVPGAVFTADDRHVRLPEEDGATRTVHGKRWVVVVSAEALNRAVSPRTVLVVPCSASQGGADAHDFDIPEDEKGFSAAGVVAYASLVHFLLKEHLGDRQGVLRKETLEKLHAAILANLGVVHRPRVALPPRESSAISGVHSAGSGPVPASPPKEEAD